MIKLLTILMGSVIIIGYGGSSQNSMGCPQGVSVTDENILCIEYDKRAGTISVFRGDGEQLVLTQHTRENDRPYIHPIVAPDGNGVLTQYRPGHHLHQTGLYWGLKKVNGRDYFTNRRGDYWRRVSANVIDSKGETVNWQVVYDLLDEKGNAVLTETHTWSIRVQDRKYLLDLEWKGEARVDVTVGKFFCGGLFLRMPWHEGIRGQAVNSSGQRNYEEAEGQRAIWVDVGMEIEGRDDLAHIAIFDHPDNDAFPTPWRVDGRMGVGPSRQILGDWKIDKGETEVIRYRLVVYTGELNPVELTRMWTSYAVNSGVSNF